MKKTILTVGLAGLLASAAYAQAPLPATQAAPPSPPATQDAPTPEFNPDSVRTADAARIQAVKASLNLTPDQEKKWPDAEAAAKRYNEARLGNVLKARDRRPAVDPLAAMQERTDGILLTGNSLRALVDDLKPLYATLNDDQKHKLMALIGFAPPRQSMGQRPPIAGMTAPAPAAAMSPNSPQPPVQKPAAPTTPPPGK